MHSSRSLIFFGILSFSLKVWALAPPTTDQVAYHATWLARAQIAVKDEAKAKTRAEKIKINNRFIDDVLEELRSVRKSLIAAQEENPSVESKVDLYDKRETELLQWKVAFDHVRSFTDELKGAAPTKKKCEDVTFEIRLGELSRAPEDQKLSEYAVLATQSVADICSSLETLTGGTSRTVTPAQPVSVPAGSI